MSETVDSSVNSSVESSATAFQQNALRLRERYDGILNAASEIAAHCGRTPESVRLLAVSKTQPYSVLQSALDAGITMLGENYAQELRDKGLEFTNRSKAGLLRFEPEWHFIGHLQTNKVRMVLPFASWIHSVDSVKLLKELNKEAPKLGRTGEAMVNILLQVNTSGEEAKSGCMPEEAFSLAEEALQCQHVRLRGLMTIAALADDEEVVRPMFRLLREIRDELRARFRGFSYFGHDAAHTAFEELSMGMTGDFRAAIEEGSTIIRVGTAIFGERSPRSVHPPSQ
jgi:pyridoxal phosphate enzyme (YggS family)